MLSSYFVEYVRGGDPSTELIRSPAFPAADDVRARQQAKELLSRAGVDVGTLFRLPEAREEGTDDPIEIGRVEV